MERLDELSLQSETGDGPPTGRVERLERARAAVLAPPASRVTAVATRVTATGVLNGVLSSFSKGVPADEKPALAKALLAVLDEPQLKTIVDSHGLSPRALAVEAVLSLGYPWALSLNPEDLAFYRAQTKPSSRFRPWMVLALIATLGLGLGASGLFASNRTTKPPPPGIEKPHAALSPSKGFVWGVPKSSVEIAQVWPVEPIEGGMKVNGVAVPLGKPSAEQQSLIAKLQGADPSIVLRSLETCHLDAVSCSALKIIALRMFGTDLAFQESVEEAIALERMPASREVVEAVREASLRGVQNQAFVSW